MKKQNILIITTACWAAVAGLVQADVLYDWDFGTETNNTMLNQVLSSGAQSPVTFSSSAMSSNTVVSGGKLVISEQDGAVNGAANNAFADITDLSSGTYWLVTEFSGWDISVGALDLAFSAAGIGGQEIANVRFVGGSSVRARCFYNGSYEDIFFSSPEFPITFAVELNLDTDKTRFLYKIGAGDWQSTVEYDAKSASDIAYLRFSASDMLSDEKMQMDQLYVTDISPIPEPATLGLFLMTGCGLILARRIRC